MEKSSHLAATCVKQLIDPACAECITKPSVDAFPSGSDAEHTAENARLCQDAIAPSEQPTHSRLQSSTFSMHSAPAAAAGGEGDDLSSLPEQWWWWCVALLRDESVVVVVVDSSEGGLMEWIF